jgi:hypothetical protein
MIPAPSTGGTPCVAAGQPDRLLLRQPELDAHGRARRVPEGRDAAPAAQPGRRVGAGRPGDAGDAVPAHGRGRRAGRAGHVAATTARSCATRDVQKVYDWAREVNGIFFVDIQVGTDDIRNILPRFEWILKNPDVHLGIDPEFMMKDGSRPGSKIGTMDAADINYAIDYLAKLVREHNLPPKVLRRPPLHAADGDELPEHPAAPGGAGRDAHGRLGRALAEARHLPRLRGPRAGPVRGVQDLLPQRCASRSAWLTPSPGRRGSISTRSGRVSV